MSAQKVNINTNLCVGFASVKICSILGQYWGNYFVVFSNVDMVDWHAFERTSNKITYNVKI